MWVIFKFVFTSEYKEQSGNLITLLDIFNTAKEKYKSKVRKSIQNKISSTINK